MMYLSQNLSLRLRHALRRGEILRARNILVDEIIPREGAQGQYIQASLLSYELGEYEEARYLFAKAEEGRKPGQDLAEHRFQLSKRLIESGDDLAAFRKTKLMVTEDRAALRQIVMDEFQIAASGSRFKTARLLLKELEALGIPRDKMAANEDVFKREVLRSGTTFLFTSPVSPPIAITPPPLATASRLKDIETLSRGAEISSRYVSSMRNGAYSQAKKILLEELIPLRPGDAGNHLKAAQLCFELEEFGEAKRHFRRYVEMTAGDKNPPDFNAQVQAFGLLIESEGRSSPPWESLPILRSDLVPVVVLERECGRAIAHFRFRTARILLLELQRLGIDEEKRRSLRRLLDERIQAQREQPENHPFRLIKMS